MDTRDDVPKFNITIDYIESADGAPTGRVTRVKHDTRGQITSREELFIDPATLRTKR
jgi:hypothetical protein